VTTHIMTPYSAQTTADDVLDGLDLAGQRIIVTGGASGIGVETARALAGAGAEVTLAVRNLDAGRRVAAQLTAETGSKQVLVAPLDLADQTSVRSFVASWHGPLHVLINNAGLMAAPLMRTPAGWEMQFATNHLGHFTLTTGLRGPLAAAARAAGQARVVSVSSSAHLRSGIVFDDIHFHLRPYEPWSAYAQSKTANILLAVEGSARWADDGIAINALMPGAIRTGLQRYVSDEELDRIRAATGNSAPAWKTPQQGASTSALLAASPLLDGVAGKYFEDCNEALPNEPGTRRGVAAHALDPEAAARLWQVSANLVRA
jgi:NAD(P)-dependent dehydrogenase (short-subunit alcohol dehydrogenase family)